jgi:hypothetical protein
MYNLYNLEANYTINRNFRKKNVGYHFAEILSVFLIFIASFIWLWL